MCKAHVRLSMPCAHVSKHQHPFSATTSTKHQHMLHHITMTKYARLLAAYHITLFRHMMFHLRKECIQEKKFKVKARRMRNTLLLCCHPVNFTTFCRMQLSLISLWKERFLTAQSAVCRSCLGRFGSGRINWGQHTVQAHNNTDTEENLLHRSSKAHFTAAFI